MKNIQFSSRYLLIFIQFVVAISWMNVLAFHQTWLCLTGKVSWNVGFILSVLISLIPLIWSISLLRNKPPLPICSIHYRDAGAIILLMGLGLFFWYFFSKGALDFPTHMYGDESFHSNRIMIMARDFQTWFHYFFSHGEHPGFPAEYMFYPPLGYTPITLLTAIFGDTSLIADQRTSLVVYYLSVIFTTYLLARLLIQSQLLSILIALLSVSSALLLAYTTSFYMELPYVSVLIFSFWLLAWGIKNDAKEIVITAVLVASLAPIIREPALAATGCIILSAILWQYFHDKSILQGKQLSPLYSQQLDFRQGVGRNEHRSVQVVHEDANKTNNTAENSSAKSIKQEMHQLLSAATYFVIGYLPFFAYYTAKSHYTDWDKTRTSLAFIFQQDYLALLKCAFIYLGPLALIAFIFFLLFPLREKLQERVDRYLVLAAMLGILGALLTESIFIPGYMPWSRNYLFYYAQFTVLIIVFIKYFWRHRATAIFALLLPCVAMNIYICVLYLQNDDFFHESETVFDFRPISTYIEQHFQQFENQKIYIIWPPGFPTYPEKLLPHSIKLEKITLTPPESRFPEFFSVQKALPRNAHYFLFYYLKNESKPKAFHGIPSVAFPQPIELKGYKILVQSVDPWSNGKNGVLLLEKV